MIYKLANRQEVEELTNLSPMVKETLLKYTGILADEYGAEREVDHYMGGYVLYCESGTSAEELIGVFDYREHLLEWIEWGSNFCVALFLLTDDYGVMLVMAKEDAPKEILQAIQEDDQ